jgi:hypothetical protein
MTNKLIDIANAGMYQLPTVVRIACRPVPILNYNEIQERRNEEPIPSKMQIITHPEIYLNNKNISAGVLQLTVEEIKNLYNAVIEIENMKTEPIPYGEWLSEL